MKSRTHIFLAAFPASRGEITLALRIAKELSDRGDRIIFIACKVEAEVFRGRPVEFIPVDSMRSNFDHDMNEIVRLYKPHSIILVDVLTNSVTFEYFKVPKTFFENTQVPILALDVYRLINGRERGDLFFNRVIDFRYLNSFPSLRLYPVPFNPPDGIEGNYCALPHSVPKDALAARKELGISSEEKIVLMVGTAWQVPSFWDDPDCRRLSSLSPLLLLNYLSKVDSRIRVLHVGPEPYRTPEPFRDRYSWISPVDAARFQSIVAASDLFLTLNLVGTTLSTAIASGLPMVVVRNSVTAKSVKDALGNSKSEPSETLKNWLNAAIPIYPFLAWPIGYHQLVSPLLINNPFCATYRSVELLDELGFLQACSELLFDSTAREQMIQAQTDYASQVRKLPSASALIEKHLAESS